jgi:acyl-CoA thioester hydrolase
MQYQMMGFHSAKTRVRFGQTDRYGYTWHGHLPTFFEEGRADFARRYGLGTDTLLRQNLSMPIIELAAEYCHASYEDEILDIQLTLLRPVLKLPGFVFLYRIFGGPAGRTEIARGRTRQVLLSRDGAPLVRTPATIAELLEAAWENLKGAPRWSDAHLITESRSLMGDVVVPLEPLIATTTIQPKEPRAHEDRA